MHNGGKHHFRPDPQSPPTWTAPDVVPLQSQEMRCEGTSLCTWSNTRGQLQTSQVWESNGLSGNLCSSAIPMALLPYSNYGCKTVQFILPLSKIPSASRTGTVLLEAFFNTWAFTVICGGPCSRSSTPTVTFAPGLMIPGAVSRKRDLKSYQQKKNQRF